MVTKQLQAAVMGKFIDTDLDQPQAMPRDHIATPLVVERSLLAAVNTTDRQPVRLVKMRNGLAMLTFVNLDHQRMLRVIGVHR